MDNVLDYTCSGGGVAGTDRHTEIDDAATRIVAAWQTDLLPHFCSDYTLENISWVDLDSSTGEVGTKSFSGSSPHVGGNTAAGATPQVAVLVKKITSGGRGSRQGRIYLAPPPEAGMDAAGLLIGSYLSDVQIALRAFLSHSTTDTVAGVGEISDMVVTHFGPRPIRGSVDNRVGTHTKVTDLVLEPLVATQRRRLR